MNLANINYETGIRRWQQRPQMELKTHALSAVQKHNIYTLVSENKEVVKGMNQLSTCLIHVRGVSIFCCFV